MGPAQHGKRTLTLLACTAVLCTPATTAAAEDLPAATPSAVRTTELPDEHGQSGTGAPGPTSSKAEPSASSGSPRPSVTASPDDEGTGRPTGEPSRTPGSPSTHLSSHLSSSHPPHSPSASADDGPATSRPPAHDGSRTGRGDHGNAREKTQHPSTAGRHDSGARPDGKQAEPARERPPAPERPPQVRPETAQPPALDSTGPGGAAAETQFEDTSEREPGDHTSRASTGRVLPVLTLGAGIASIGLGLGFLAFRLRRR